MRTLRTMNLHGTNFFLFVNSAIVLKNVCFLHCRIAKLELVDEIEELELVLGHYVVSWAVKADRGVLSERAAASEMWGLKRKARGPKDSIAGDRDQMDR